MALAVGQLGIDLIGDHHDLRVPQHLGQSLQVLPLHNAAGGVGGEGQHQRLGAGGNGGLQLLRRQAELVLCLQLHIDRDTPRHLGERSVADKGWDGDDNLVPRVQQHPQGEIQRLAAPYCDQDLAGVVVFQAEPAVQIAGDLPPQLRHARVGGIFGVPPLQGIDTRISDVPGCHKVGFPDAQGNGVLHLLQNIKKLPNARGLDALDLLIQDRLIIHTKIYSLSWGS